MLRILLLAGAAAAAVLSAQPASANSRYGERPPLVVSPDLSAPWVMQLKRSPDGRRVAAPAVRRNVAARNVPQLRQLRRTERQTMDPTIRTAAVAVPPKREQQYQINPMYLPQDVAYDGPQGAGTIVIDTTQNFLYLVQGGGTARRYGVGTGKPGFEWAGTHKITRKAEWPDWRPPAEMIVRERAKGRILPVHMAARCRPAASACATRT
jgi:lipoprotein-anchoring transpeptidase ErfK/SrfK